MARRIPKLEARGLKAGGFTLIEILISMGIISVLMGFGIGLYQRMTSLGKSTQARNTILEERRKVQESSKRFGRAELVVDPKARVVYGLWLQTVASSNFEAPVDEADITSGIVVGLQGKDGMKRGDGVLMPYPHGHTGGGLVSETGTVIDFGNYADYDLREGVRIDVWVYPVENIAMPVIQKGESYGIRLRRGPGGPLVQGFLELGVEGKDSKRVRPVKERYDASHALVMNRWNRIIMNYDRNKVTIAIDSYGRGPVIRLEKAENRPIAVDLEANLTVGGPDGLFTGRMDDLKVAGIRSGVPKPLPEEVELVGEGIRKIRYFEGKLDPAHHQGSETILLRYKGVDNPITIGVSGNLQE